MTILKQAQACFFHYQVSALRICAVIGVLLLGSACDGSAPGPDPEGITSQDTALQEVSGPIMGTRYSVKWSGKAFPEADAVILAELERINSLMSTYDPESELSRFNNSPVGEWYTVAADTLATLKVSQEVYQASKGALDVTVGSLVNLWGFGPQGRITREPSQAAIDAAQAGSGFDKLDIDAEQSRIRKTSDIYVDLSAVAKGYAVDEVAEVLENEDIDDYLVDIGGELRMSGLKPDGSQWRIAIEAPKVEVREIFEVFSFEKAAIATSGDYRNYFEEDGVRYSHTIDPRTGRPIQHALVSVSVVTQRCAVADAWATALMAVGPETAKALSRSHNLAVLLIMKGKEGFDTWTSPQLEVLQSSQPNESASDQR
ncbi:FAD:protein FMN transferase [Allohahella marinimesophila]|uniref:FAD:protein FMN transferase n=1 Tax=Allohahella marinimesophila TaxID=1054972 RepID=A0ABP7Q9B6_9GAMM